MHVRSLFSIYSKSIELITYVKPFSEAFSVEV